MAAAKKNKHLPQPQSLDSPLLAQFPIAPVTKRPKFDVVVTKQGTRWHTNRVEWEEQEEIDGKVVEYVCSFERKVPESTTFPNYTTQQVLNALLFALEQQRGWDLTIPTVRVSIQDIIRIMDGDVDIYGETIKDNDYGKRASIVKKHLGILQDMRISYGKRKKGRKTSDVLESTIIESIQYKEKTQRVRRGDGDLVEATIDELKSITFSSAFIARYLSEKITYDFFIYLDLETPTLQNFYRYYNYLVNKVGLKNVNTVHDLQKFARVNLGIQNQKAEDRTKARKLASDMKRHLEPFRSVYPGGDFRISRDKKQPSGYSIALFHRPMLFDAHNLRYTLHEQQAYVQLRAFGLFHPGVCRLIHECKKSMLHRAGTYILFCLQQFNKRRVKGDIKAPKDAYGRVLYTEIQKGNYYKAFAEEGYHPTGGQEYYRDLALDKDYFDMETFSERYPEVYLRLKKEVTEQFSQICESLANTEVFQMSALRAMCLRYNNDVENEKKKE